jgi:hypothetical protein
MDYEATGGYIGLGAESGLRPDGCFEGVHSVVRPPGYPKPLVLNRFGLLLAFLALVRTSKAVLPTSEEREKPMSSDPESDDEQLEVDDGTLSEVVRRPTRTAGDLAEAADASPGITTEALARDLETVASKRGVPTESELLADLLRRVERIEEHLGITN